MTGRGAAAALLVVATAAGLALPGCSLLRPWSTQTAEYWGPRYGSMVTTNYAAADRMQKVLKDRLPPSDPVLVSTFVSIDDLSQSSTFGRVSSEQIASRLAQRGYRVIDLKLRDESALIKKRQGEFFLSRDLKHISLEHNAQAVLVGTYAVGQQVIHVSARVVRTNDNSLLASDDYNIALSPDVRKMIK
ncbi:FlgO family outer membrane protein [Thermodesulfobacteriota bacterium]